LVPDRPPVDVVATIELEPAPQSARWARRFIADFCTAAGLPEEVCHSASLLTSELVTNAVLHGQTSATLTAHRPGDLLRVAVRDDNPALPALGQDPVIDPNAEGGRGLAIVSMLASRWGVEMTTTGKAIWFELDLPARPEDRASE
jgi:anti-sigma regulatory factor (Ser/Thr protein kinase)